MNKINFIFMLILSVAGSVWGNSESMDFFLDNNDIIIVEHNEDSDIYTIKIINNDKLKWVIAQIKISSSTRQSYPELIFHIGEKVIIAGGHSIYWSGPSYVVGTEYVYTPEVLTGELRKLFNFIDGNDNVISVVNVERQWRR